MSGDWSSDTVGKLGYRSRDLVAAILGLLDGEEFEPVGWVALVGAVGELSGERWSWSTIEAAIRDLVWAGAVAVEGRVERGRPDPRRVRLTLLGDAWWSGESVPSPIDDTAVIDDDFYLSE